MTLRLPTEDLQIALTFSCNLSFGKFQKSPAACNLQLILQPDSCTSDPLPVQALVEEIETAMTVFAHGLNDLVKDRGETPESEAS